MIVPNFVCVFCFVFFRLCFSRTDFVVLLQHADCWWTESHCDKVVFGLLLRLVLNLHEHKKNKINKRIHRLEIQLKTNFAQISKTNFLWQWIVEFFNKLESLVWNWAEFTTIGLNNKLCFVINNWPIWKSPNPTRNRTFYWKTKFMYFVHKKRDYLLEEGKNRRSRRITERKTHRTINPEEKPNFQAWPSLF